MILAIFAFSLLIVFALLAQARRVSLILLGINLVLVLMLLWHLMTDVVPINW